ncbi:MAG: polysaccharide pyruvyl transferase family protein [Acidimicrobiales bacterium]|nr:polysaccharide pyruvyl transferase family protein [Acidimicrobiales bacterium]
MASVVLPCMDGGDPLGESALEAAFRMTLPGYQPLLSADRPLQAAMSPEGRKAEAVVIAGCELFPAGPNQLGISILPALAARVSSMGRDQIFALVGVSAAAPTRLPDKWAARRLIRSAHLVLLSDGESASALAGAGVPAPLRVSSDPAWLALSSVTARGGSGRSVVVALDGNGAPSVDGELMAGLSRLARTGMEIRLLPWADRATADIRSAEDLARHLSAIKSGCVEVVPPADDLAGAAQHMSDAYAVVSLRYRGLHAAAAAGVPVVAVGVESRTKALAARLGQTYVRPDRVGRELEGAVRRAVASPAPSPAVVKEEIARAEAGLALLRLVLRRGDVDTSNLEFLPLAPVPWL